MLLLSSSEREQHFTESKMVRITGNFYLKNYIHLDSITIESKDDFINNLVLCYVIENGDTVTNEYDLSLLETSKIEEKTFFIKGHPYTIKKLKRNYTEIFDADYELFLIENNKFLLIHYVDWLTVKGIYRNDIEKELLRNLVNDTSGFFASPPPPLPPNPNSLHLH